MHDESLFSLEDDNFKFQSNGVTLIVKRLNFPGQVAFHISFSSPRKPITIARATKPNGVKFWTSIPEGQNRENEAMGVGTLIENYLKEK